MTEVKAVTAPAATFLSKTEWKTTVLVSTRVASHNSRYYRFALERDDQLLGLVSPVISHSPYQRQLISYQPIGQHVFIRMRGKPGVGLGDGELVQRAYTPVSHAGAVGYLDLLIKLYLPDQHYPNGGKMSWYGSISPEMYLMKFIILLPVSLMFSKLEILLR